MYPTQEDMEKLTAKKLYEICRVRFRMSAREGSARARIYEALSRQPQSIKDLVSKDISEEIDKGIVKYTRKRRPTEVNEQDDAPRAQKRKRYVANEASDSVDSTTVPTNADGKQTR